MKNKETIKCPNCQKKFIEYKSNNRKFCCYKCAMDFRKGTNRPKSVIEKMIATKRKRRLTIKNSAHKRAYYVCPNKKPCEQCGETDLKRIDRHHIDYNPFNNNKNNIQFLCKICHAHIHKNWEKRYANISSKSI